MSTARVMLRGAETYKLQGRTWLKGVAGVVKGEDQIKSFEENGYFHVKRLSSSKDEASNANPKKLLKRSVSEGSSSQDEEK